MRHHYLKMYCNRRMLTMLLLGFASGLPLALTGATLQAWYTVSGVSIVAIGLLGLVGQPYVYKFLWAPVMDRFVPPLLGRRRGWMLVTQVGLVITIVMMALSDPKVSPLWLAVLALVAAFLSASQDISIDAYRTDLLTAEERGLGAAMNVGGYRLAMIASGGLALILAAEIGWRATYLLMAVFMLIGIIASWIGPEPENHVTPPASLIEALVDPFKEFFKRQNIIAILVLIVIYKLGDAFALSLSTPFLIRGIGFSLVEVGLLYKTVGLFASLLGVFIGGTLMVRIGLYRALFYFGILQAGSNLLFMFLALAGKSYPLMISAIFTEYLCGGLATAAFVAFLMSLCDKRYTATQFALLSALAAIGRVFAGPLAGYMVETTNWATFYLWTVIIAIPGVIMVWLLRQRINIAEHRAEHSIEGIAE